MTSNLNRYPVTHRFVTIQTGPLLPWHRNPFGDTLPALPVTTYLEPQPLSAPALEAILEPATAGDPAGHLLRPLRPTADAYRVPLGRELAATRPRRYA